MDLQLAEHSAARMVARLAKRMVAQMEQKSVGKMARYWAAHLVPM
jgi:hypothetical protein